MWVPEMKRKLWEYFFLLLTIHIASAMLYVLRISLMNRAEVWSFEPCSVVILHAVVACFSIPVVLSVYFIEKAWSIRVLHNVALFFLLIFILLSLVLVVSA